MEFRILGPLEVLENGTAIDIGSAKQRTLLAVLLLNANHVVSSDELLEALWDEQPPGTALKALQVYVSQLRKTLGKERILTRVPGYELRVEPGELDLERFQTLVSDGKLEQALVLWRGRPLAEFRYEPFAQAEIGRLEELRLACLEDRIESDLQAGRHPTLVGEIDALVREHPLRERLRAQLMLALYRSGRQAEALESYQDARRALTEGLGIEPSLELRELEKAILQQDAGLTAVPVAEAAAESGDAARGAFVGREEELEELLQGFADAVAGRGRLYLLVGEPGIGKSRLADEVLRHARVHGAEALAGRCWEGGGAPAYWPWMQSIREYVRTADSDALRLQLGSGVADVAQIIPEVRERLPDISEPGALESESARFRLFDSTAAFVKNAAAQRPWVLVLDDLHAADEPSLLLLRFLAGELAGARILVVGTYRDVDPTVRDPLASTLSELARERVTRRIHLTGLTKPDVARYIELETLAVPSADLATAIHDETEGNPLFVGEVVRLLAEEGNLANVDVRTLSTLGIPQGVREVIGRRLRSLSDEGAGLLALASVLGREFRIDALERLAELDVDRVLDALDEAIWARLVMPVPGTLGRLRFAHALIRDTLYDDMTTPRRVLLHRRAAEALEEIYAANPEPHLAELTYHYFEAAPGGDVDKALSYAERAASRALKLLAFEEAARFYELALQVLELKPAGDAVARCEMLLGLGEAQARAGGEDAASAAFLVAAELARSAGFAEQLARAALGYGGLFVWMVSGIDEKVVPLLDAALRELGERDSALRAKVLARLAGALRDQPEPERRTELTEQAVSIARRLEDHSALAYALDGQYCALWGPDNPEERLDIADELLIVSSEVGDRERRIQGHYYRAVAFLELGRVDEARAELEAMDRVASELRQPAHHWYVEVLRGILDLFGGDFEEAERSIATGLELARTLRSRLSPMAFNLQSMMLERERGQLDQGIAIMEQSVDGMPTLTAFRCVLARLYAERGRDAEAGAILKAVAETDFEVLPDNDKLYGWSLLGEVCFALRDPTHAPRLYELLSPYARRNVVCHPGCAIGSASRYLGLLATLLERFDEASRHFEDALAMNEKMGARPWLAHTQHDYARLLVARGTADDRAKGDALRATALATYRELGMAGPLAKAESIAAS
jgi:DNA-binding SARP family transcriptional activator